MELTKVRDVMTSMVVAVRQRADYKEIVDALAGYGVSAVPVLDDEDRVVGVVSEADLLPKLEYAGDDPRARRLIGTGHRAARAKAAGCTAAELMSAPARTIDPDATIAEAARTMERESVKRLPVVGGGGRLAGIVTRRDLLRVYLRPDAAIADDVAAEVVDRALGLGPAQVRVEVTDGVVTLAGAVERHSTARLAVRLTRTVPGVVDVVDRLAYRVDDRVGRDSRYVFESGV
ncbi:CBS domain-containing protein [Planosporangium sp. 12N6]|uniref:CBS domain-containing protein n=1 Tax=Planosporangium spinosum TaxID=3402278 RepID=UPI003CF5995E